MRSAFLNLIGSAADALPRASAYLNTGTAPTVSLVQAVTGSNIMKCRRCRLLHFDAHYERVSL